jgi:hypothetical protein
MPTLLILFSRYILIFKRLISTYKRIKNVFNDGINKDNTISFLMESIPIDMLDNTSRLGCPHHIARTGVLGVFFGTDSVIMSFMHISSNYLVIVDRFTEEIW